MFKDSKFEKRKENLEKNKKINFNFKRKNERFQHNSIN